MPEPEAAAAAEEGCRSGDWGATKSTLALALAAKRTDSLAMPVGWLLEHATRADSRKVEKLASQCVCETPW